MPPKYDKTQVIPPSSPSNISGDGQAQVQEDPSQQQPGSSQASEPKTDSSPATANMNLTPEQQAQREKKMNTITTSITNLESEISQLNAQLAETRSKLKNDPTTTVRHHIRLLHEYNEIKDIGQGLMGLIADARGMRQVEVQEEFGVSSED